MEEILASIRRIISDDEETGEGGDAKDPEAEEAPEEEPAAEADEDEDVLELTDVVDEDEPAIDDDALSALDDSLDLEPEVDPVSFDDPAPEPEPEPEIEDEDDDEEDEYELVDSIASSSSGTPDLDSLLSAHAASAATDAFSGLTGAVSSTRGVPLGNVNQTLEDIVKELLRPMLKEWLDDNLPSLVERMVEKEIIKIVGRADKL